MTSRAVDSQRPTSAALRASLKIGEVARRCNVSARTIRYYEEVGLLEPQGATEGGFRLYSEDEVERVQRILNLKECLNFTLDEIRTVITADDELTTLRAEGRITVDPLRKLDIYVRYEAALNSQRELVLRKRAQLDTFLEELDARRARLEDRRTEIEQAASQVRARSPKSSLKVR